MKLLNKILLCVLASLSFAGSSLAADEAPDALIKRLSQEILDIAKADKDIQSGNQKRVFELVEAKVLPYIDLLG